MTLIQKTLLFSSIFLISCQSIQIPLFSDRPSYKERHAELEAEKKKKRTTKKETTIVSSTSSSANSTKSTARKRNSKRTANAKNLSLRSEILEDAKKYIGIPYTYGGKEPLKGFDCSGFSTFVFAQNGVPLNGSSKMMSKMGVPVSFNQIKKGDLAFFGTNGKVTHVAIVVTKTNDEFKVLHSTSSKGVMSSDILQSKYWMGKYLFSRDVLTNFDYGLTGLD